jgi:hypothetical protein
MNDNTTGPVIIFLLFILRCLIPLAIMFGISYILQRLGLVGYCTEEDTQHPAPEDKNTVRPARPAGRVPRQKKRKSGAPRTRSRGK